MWVSPPSLAFQTRSIKYVPLTAWGIFTKQWMHNVSTRLNPACYPLDFQALMVHILITVYNSNTHTRTHRGHFINNAQGGKTAEWCNSSESYVSYSWRLEETAHVVITSLVYAVLNWRVLDMVSVGTSGTVTVEDQRSYIKIETLRGKKPTEIWSALHEICGEQTVGRSTVSHWATRFCEGRVTINNDPRTGRPKTSTDERSVKLVAVFLAEDCQVTCEEISQVTGISPTSVFCILTNDLQKRKICAPWVPHCLTAEQKQKRLKVATLL